MAASPHRREHIPFTSLLKVPRQRRARATVTAILDAAVRVLDDGDPGAFTTNRVAEVAGVSVGTLYQYFANKEAVVAAVVERGLLTVEDTLRSSTRSLDLPVEVAMAGALHAVLEMLEPSRALLSTLMAAGAMPARGDLLGLLEPRLMAVAHDFLLRRPDVRVRGGGASVFVAVHGSIYAVLRWLAEPSPWVRREDLVDAIVRQTMAHLDIQVAGDAG